jgi:glycosyltransferase involved in cell wall biosynthesis
MKKILFLYLDAFSITGGIEKFNKAFMKVLQDISKDGTLKYESYSAFDEEPDLRYVDAESYLGFKGNRFSFAFKSIKSALKSNVVILGHINLAPIGLIIKLVKPQVKIILIAHGVEVWDKLAFIKNIFLKRVDLILAVSSFTKNKIIEKQNIKEEKIAILNNTLDPFFKIPEKFEKPEYLLKRYNLDKEIKILLTVGRINNEEGRKGYDKVIEILPEVVNQKSNLVYILAGKFDKTEKQSVMKLVEEKRVQNNFIMPGFIEDEELTDHYLLADVFVMPSTQEGFGIVFLEALVCGLPVIAGNKDGSVEALMNGKLGMLVDPDNTDEILKSVISTLENPIVNNQVAALEHFGFNQFKKKLRAILVEN